MKVTRQCLSAKFVFVQLHFADLHFMLNANSYYAPLLLTWPGKSKIYILKKRV